MQEWEQIFAGDEAEKRKIIFYHSIYFHIIYSIIYILLPPKHILQILPDVLFPQPCEVGINIPRRPDIRMTQPLLDVFQLPAFRNAMFMDYAFTDKHDGVDPTVYKCVFDRSSDAKILKKYSLC